MKRTTFHWTSAADARQIVAEGVRIARTDPEATWGHGFYTSTRYLPGFGDTSVHVAVRLLRPLVVEDRIAAREWLDELRVALGTDDVRSTLLAAGSDGVVILWESGEMWVVAYDDLQVLIAALVSKHGRAGWPTGRGDDLTARGCAVLRTGGIDRPRPRR